MLQTNSGPITTQQDKENEAFMYFSSHLGTSVSRTRSLDWTSLSYQQQDLHQLETPFGVDEVKETIFSMPSDKAPGSDGFICLFFRVCWDILKNDMVASFQQLYDLHAQHFELTNSANIVLFPKKARFILNYRFSAN